ncbi:glycosyltransferase [Ekhidna sp.]|uniref:glycosyltransferase n=1 Tax=Ekhidna sp. TaxID=2608089 RepID=UPI003B50C9E2
MKVGVIVDNEYSSDVRVKREVRLLKTLGYEVYILCLSFNKIFSYQEDGVFISPLFISKKHKNILYFLMNTIPLYEWWWRKRIKRFLNVYKPQIVHTHDLYMSKCVRQGIKDSKWDIPMILDLHENYPHAIQSYKWTQGFIRTLLVQPKKWIKKEARYLSYADRLVVLSQDFKDSLLERYPNLKEENLLVFPNVVDTEEFDQFEVKSIETELPEKPRVLYFGIVADRRGIFRSLKAFEELLTDGVKFSMIIVGPVDSGDKDRFFQEINKSIFKDSLLYIPWIELSVLPSYLKACDLALAPFDKNPQHESGIANKIFQYMYGGLPILASDCKPQQELIEKHNIGEVFTSDNELTLKLKYLIEHENDRKAMGERAYKVLINEFHHEAFIPQFKSLYENLLS